jgi:predicted Rossmann fold nucleotide-binding protein DprA/Smf involved in DNA uptake
MPKVIDIQPRSISLKEIRRFRTVSNYIIRDSRWPNSVPRVMKKEYKRLPPDNYIASDAIPPQTIYFGSKTPNANILNANLAVALIGTAHRKIATEAGRELSTLLAQSVIQYDPTALIVSGDGFGIDRAAHLGAIKADGKTVAVVPNGVEFGLARGGTDLKFYLQEEIPKHGAFVSIHPYFKKPNVMRALARNHIISALSDVVVVIECDKNSRTIDAALKAALQGVRLLVVDWSRIHGERPRPGNAWLLEQNIPNRKSLEAFPEYGNYNLTDLGKAFADQILARGQL